MTTTQAKPRTIPSKERVLKAAESCPQTKDALRILFPQDFEPEFDWADFRSNPFDYLTIDRPDIIYPSTELRLAYAAAGPGIPGNFWPRITLTTLKRLVDYLCEHAEVR